LVLFGSLFVQQLGQLASSLPETVTEIVVWLNNTFGLAIDSKQAVDSFALTPEQLGNFASQWQGGVVGLVAGVLNVFVNLVVIIVFSFYLAADAPRIRRTIASWMPQESQRVVITVWDISIEKAGSFVLSKIILASISSVAYSAFFFLIGVPFWLPMGVFVGFVGQFIPMVGTYIGLAVPMVFTLTVKPINALWIVLFGTAYQQLETYLLTPRLANRVMSMNSGLALAAVFIGAALFGPVGAIIGIPLLAIVIAVAETYGHRYDLVPELERKGEYEDPNYPPRPAESV
ncbi:MAG: AI-2E family transporter, partial [Actinomycetota bacterium]